MRYGRVLLPFDLSVAPLLLPLRVRATSALGLLKSPPGFATGVPSAPCRTLLSAVALASIAPRAETHLDSTARAPKHAGAPRHRNFSADGDLRKARGTAMLRTARDFGSSRLRSPGRHRQVLPGLRFYSDGARFLRDRQALDQAGALTCGQERTRSPSHGSTGTRGRLAPT